MACETPYPKEGEMTDDGQIVAAMRRVQEGNVVLHDPDGDYPKCKPALGTTVCDQCKQDVRATTGACPAVPRDKRWRMEE